MPKFDPDSQPNIHDFAVEEPEKQEFEGRDPEVYLNEVFDWLENSGRTRRWSWHWGISEDGKTIDMQTFRADEIPSVFFDCYEAVVFKGRDMKTGKGIDSLLTELQGKKIISIKYNDNWYLKTIDEKKGKLQPETQQMPEQKQF